MVPLLVLTRVLTNPVNINKIGKSINCGSYMTTSCIKDILLILNYTKSMGTSNKLKIITPTNHQNTSGIFFIPCHYTKIPTPGVGMTLKKIPTPGVGMTLKQPLPAMYHYLSYFGLISSTPSFTLIVLTNTYIKLDNRFK